VTILAERSVAKRGEAWRSVAKRGEAWRSVAKSVSLEQVEVNGIVVHLVSPRIK